MLDLATSTRYCTYCPKLCRHTCPVSHAEARETLTPQTKMATLRVLNTGELPLDTTSSASLYGCTGCGACTEACRHEITPGRHLFTGRALAESGEAGHPALVGLTHRLRTVAERAAQTVAAQIPEARRATRGPTALFPACQAPELAPTALTLFDRAQAHLPVAKVSRLCGGYPLLAGGLPDAFRLHAETLSHELAGFDRVAVACPACAWAMKVEYPAHGVPLRPTVIHTSQLLAEVADRLTPTRKLPAAFYHDPCYLGRHLGLYEPPRQALRLALDEVREFSRCRATSECSGGGGLLPITMPKTAAAIARARLSEVHEAGLQRVVTGCATCQRQLHREGIVAYDLIEMVEQATRPVV